jgi:phosphohistidine phosphatase SixA
MKKLLLVFAFSVFTVISYAQEVTTYYLIRHAEKQRQNPNDKDPSLTFDGFKRAEKWKTVFQYVSLDAVYSTNYNRTKLTAKPTADAKNLPVLLYDPSKMYSESFRYNTKGKDVLIVGHSNTTPSFVNKIMDKNMYKEMNDNDNSSLFIVTIIDGKAAVKVLKID